MDVLFDFRFHQIYRHALTSFTALYQAIKKGYKKLKKNLKGMILAAGQGTRVRPLTKNLPKPMIPVLGKPVMEYLIEHLVRHGVTEIMVNVGHHYHMIENYFGDGHRWGAQIGYSYEGVYDHGDI
jgi:NDP-sugar pyrophosphorylase family protein